LRTKEAVNRCSSEKKKGGGGFTGPENLAKGRQSETCSVRGRNDHYDRGALRGKDHLTWGHETIRRKKQVSVKKGEREQ